MRSHLLRQLVLRPLALAICAVVAAAPASGQSAEDAGALPGGWTVTPGLLVTSSWDDNALIIGNNGETPADFVNVLNPRAAAIYKGRRGEFSGSYDGAFRLYRSLSDLNSYDQRSAVSASRLVSRHVTVFGSNELSFAPTTELAELLGLPFVRTGTTSEYLRGGASAALTKRTSLTGSYSFQVVRFDQSQVLGAPLRGGHSHGVSVTFRRALTERTALTADYNLQHATFDELEMFDIHRTEGGFEHRISQNFRVFGAAGVMRLNVNTPGLSRSGPSWRAGVARSIDSGSMEVSYSRSFVPSYGFGGTQENEELVGRLRLALTRAVYAQSGVSWRRNEPLIRGLKLRTLSIGGSVGYLLAPWASIEGFYDSTSQTIDRPGGDVDRHRLGVQIITTKPMRIR
jgi:hypothetical protein